MWLEGQPITAAEEWVQEHEVACSYVGKPGSTERGSGTQLASSLFSFYSAQNSALRNGAVLIGEDFPPQLNPSRNISTGTPNSLPW